MYLQNVTNDEVEKIVMSLITKYTSDCFEISVSVIQSLIFGILDTLTLLINKALKAQTFPECLKTAVVVPIFKSGNVCEANSYRPISLLPAISKVFEKNIYIRLASFLKHTNQLHNNQFGFRSKLGTIDALISVVDSIRYNLNKPAISTHAIFLDLKKALDTVDHSILVEKLWRMGFHGPVNTLLKSYLTNRKQKIRCGDTESSFLPLRIGVPQGSILGQILFILYVNDLPEATANLTMTLYADDTALIQLSQSYLSQLVLGMKQTIDWLDKNKLSLNFDKTLFIQFSKKGGNKSNQISFERNHIENKKSVRYLGILIDEKLKYKDHIQYLIHKMNVFLCYTLQAENCLTQKSTNFCVQNLCTTDLTVWCFNLWYNCKE